MKLTIKTLKQETFELEIPDTETVKILKEKIEIFSKNEMPASSMTLIYAGLILDNEKILKAYNISENKFIVAMIKPLTCKVATKSSTDDQTAKTKSNKSVTTNFTKDIEDGINKTDKPNINATVTATVAIDAITEPINTFSSSESLINVEQINNSIQNIIDATGYPEYEVRRAFDASFNNPDRAVEYLINGIPSNSVDNLGIDMEAIQQSITPSQNILNVNHTTSLSSSTPLEFLRTDSNFQHMRMVLRENPDLLETVILHIAESNPALLNLIIQHQNEFVNIINEPLDGLDNDNISEGDIADDEDDIDDYVPGDSLSNNTSDGQSPFRIYMTPEDLVAINRLTNLGFSEILCVEAYFACDKNEEQAANLLCSNQMGE